MNKQFSKIVIIAGIIFCSIGGFIGYKHAQSTALDDHVNLNQRIEDLFHGKDVIQDGHPEYLQGEETKYGYILYSGGFTIYKLSKESGGFVKSHLTAGDVVWTEGEYEISDFGYRMPTFRPTVKKAYSQVFEYLLKGTEKEPNLSFTRETYTEIKDFPGSFATEYYQIIQAEHPTESYSAKNTEWETGNESYKLKYNERKEFFTFSEDKSKINSLFITQSALGTGGGIILTLMLSFILRFFIPDTGKGESIFNKKWKNIETNSILTIEPKLFGKNSVTIIEGEKIKRGLAKITENGESIHLSFTDTEIFYKLKSLSSQKMEMENLASNSITRFELLGSNIYQNEADKLIENESGGSQEKGEIADNENNKLS
jgi:hypothetical protein